MVFAAALEVVAFAVLWWGANPLSAVLAVSATAFYVLVYTIWLKRTSRQNIVVGGAAGAVPVLVGWAAVRNDLGWEPVVLFAAMFFWTPPHFWALAIKYADDYRAADVPMLPTVVPLADAVRQMTLYTAALVVTTLVLIPVADLGPLYGVTALVLGVIFLGATIWLGNAPSPQASMRVFALLHHLRDRPVRGDEPRRADPKRCVVTHQSDVSVATRRFEPGVFAACSGFPAGSRWTGSVGPRRSPVAVRRLHPDKPDKRVPRT